MRVTRSTYADIGRTKADMVERNGSLGVGGIWSGRQLVGRFFIESFGTDAQRAQWLGRPAAVAISESGVGAHPKHLRTRAEAAEDGFRITGEKAWVSNADSAEVIIVFAITAEEHGRKRYTAFLVPRDTAGLSLQEMPGFHALRPSRHYAVKLDRCFVPSSASLGPVGSAFEAMALPFRDVEDAVGTFGILGAFRFIIGQLPTSDACAESRGAIAGLTAVFAAGAEKVVAALDAEQLDLEAATLIGLRMLAADLAQRIRQHIVQFAVQDSRIEEALADIDMLLSIAKGARAVRQVRLGRQAG